MTSTAICDINPNPETTMQYTADTSGLYSTELSFGMIQGKSMTRPCYCTAEFKPGMTTLFIRVFAGLLIEAPGISVAVRVFDHET